MQTSFGRTGDWQRAAIMAVNYNGGTLPDEYDFVVGSGPLTVTSTTTYTAFDHAGNVTAYSYYQPSQTFPSYVPAYGATYVVHYLKKDGYLEQSTTGTANVSGYVPATDTSYYDAFGRRLMVSQTSESNSGASQNVTRVFAEDSSGEILQRRSGTLSGHIFTATGGAATDHYTYVNGQQVSDMDEAGDISVLGTLTGFSSGSGASSYVVQSGDTLAGIAQSVYGNSSYGYIVAEANGLSGDGDLVMGQVITIPSVTTHNNTSSTFKPYNPSEVVGSTTPNLPTVPPPPPSAAGCSGLAQIVMIVVIIVATIYTAGVAAEAFGATATAAGSTSTFAIGSAALTGGGLTGVVAGSTVALGAGVGIGAAAIGGFAGSAAGQLAGDAMGIHQGFSFDEAMVGGLSAGLTAGIGGEISGAGGMLANANGTLRPAGAALFGAGAYASGVAAAKVTGQAEHFSWAGLVASAVASGVTAEAGLPGGALQRVGNTSGSFAQDLAGGVLSGALNRETSRLLGDNRVSNWASVGEDAFGNALGNAAIAGINDYDAGQQLKQAQQQAQQSTTFNEGAAADAPSGSQQSSGIIKLPDGDVVLPDGTILSGDGTGPVSYFPTNADYQEPGSRAAWKTGDHGALEALLSNQNPSAVTYDTQGVDPTAALDLQFGYGVDNSTVDAEIAKSPIMTAELNEALARGVSIQFTLDGGEYDGQNNLITIPAAYADSPDAIVSTLAHELGHAMWGDVTIPPSTALAMGRQQFVNQQVAQELQNEGVATLNDIAIEEQISPNTPMQSLKVNGLDVRQAPEEFNMDYMQFSSGQESLGQAANAIGAFYASNEFPGNDLSETYGAMYTRNAQQVYAGYITGAQNVISHAQHLLRESTQQSLTTWYQQLLSGQRHDQAQYEQAVRNYKNGGGQ